MKKLLMIAILASLFLSCGNAIMDAYNDRWDDLDAGDVVTFTIAGIEVNLVYACSSTSITFPVTSVVNSGDLLDDKAVTLTRTFFLGQTEVTNELYARILQWAYDNKKLVQTASAHNEVNATAVKYGGKELLDVDYAGDYCKINFNPSSGTFTVDAGYEKHPVTCMSWYGAVIFCNWLTEIQDNNTENVVYTGITENWTHTDTVENPAKSGYRLPSRDEWEYAARYLGKTVPAEGGLAADYVARGHNDSLMPDTLTPGYCWTPGDYASGAVDGLSSETATRLVGWFIDDPLMSGTNRAMPVMQKKANSLGIYDMSGNVHEWCFDNRAADKRARGGGAWNCTYTPYLGGVGWNDNFDPARMEVDFGFRITRTK